MTSSLLAEPSSLPAAGSSSERLRATMAAARLSFTWFVVRKTLTSQQKKQAADSFGAEGKFLSAGKKLLDTSHPAFKAVTATRGRAVSYWRSVSLPFPEPGIRLIRQDSINAFDNQIAEFRDELDEAVSKLDRQYDELRRAASNRLGELFDPADYPSSLDGMFTIERDYPSVEPPDYLRQLDPELYEQECRRAQARFSEAVQLAEHAFIDELHQLVEHLSERLSGNVDGKPKVFRDTAVTNLTEFFERFQQLNIRSNSELDELVGNARRVIHGVEPSELRTSQSLRQQVSSQLASVTSVLDGLLVDQPRRRILRRPR